MKRGYRYDFLSILLAAALLPQAQAGSVRLSPVSIDMLDHEQASSLTMFNQSSESTNYQIRVYKWTQQDGQDDLQPTDEVAVSPPILTLAPNVSYTVRVVRTQPARVVGEAAYRILIDELPKPVDRRKAGQGVSIIMRSSVPMFVANKDAMPQLAWTFDATKQQTIRIQNSGNRHALLSSLTLKDMDANKEYSIDINTINGYILSGQAKSYTVAGQNWRYDASHRYTVKATVNGTVMNF